MKIRAKKGMNLRSERVNAGEMNPRFEWEMCSWWPDVGEVNPRSIVRCWWKRITGLDNETLEKVNPRSKKCMIVSRRWWKSQVYHETLVKRISSLGDERIPSSVEELWLYWCLKCNEFIWYLYGYLLIWWKFHLWESMFMKIVGCY